MQPNTVASDGPVGDSVVRVAGGKGVWAGAGRVLAGCRGCGVTKRIYENVAYGLRLQGVKKRRVRDEAVERAIKHAALWNGVKTGSTTAP